MQTNCDIATIALANQEAQEHARDRTLLATNSQIDGKKVEIQATQTLLVGATDPDEVATYRAELIQLRAEVRELTNSLGNIARGSTVTPIVLVDNLLANAATMMGLNTRSAVAASNVVEVSTNVEGSGEDGDDESCDEGRNN